MTLWCDLWPPRPPVPRSAGMSSGAAQRLQTLQRHVGSREVGGQTWEVRGQTWVRSS